MVTHSAGFVDPIHGNIEEERWQNAFLLEYNADIKWLSLLAIYPNTNLRSAVEWLYCTNNWLSTPYSSKTSLSLSRGTPSYAFSRLTMHAKRCLPYSQDCSMICFGVKIWFLVRWPRRKPQWPSSSFDSTISRHFCSRHLYTFPGKIKE